MARVSLVIPVHNHAEEVVACLRSIERQTFKDVEAIVVDDGSTEALSLSSSRQAISYPLTMVRFERNRGAPAARNEGFRRSHGKYVMFLDADVTLEPQALEIMVKTLDAHPEAAFVYPSFHFGWKLFRGRPFDAESLKQANYIHTSALVRREVVPDFDESLKKLQDWDFFLTLIKRLPPDRRLTAGIWIPDPLYRVKPRNEGMSRWLPKCAYRIPWESFGWMPSEIRRYREAEAVVLAKHGLRATQAPQEKFSYKKRAFFWFFGIFAVEALSRAVIFHPAANAAATAIFGLAMAILTMRRPSMAIAIIAAEILVGSKGSLFKMSGDESNNGGVSVRIALHLAFIIGWFAASIRWRSWKHWRDLMRGRFAYLALGALIAYGLVLGYVRGNSMFLLSDANAWATWILLLPFLDIAGRECERVRRDVAPAVMAALFWLPVETLFLFYFFGHGFPAYATGTYLWIRRTGAGEITRVAMNAFRIFFQSHVYAAGAIVWVFGWHALQKKRSAWVQVLFVLSWAELLISLSRSLWIGTAAGLAGATAWFVWKKMRLPSFALRRTASAFACALALMAAALMAPFPPVDASSLFGLFRSRAHASEDAAVSRWNLLPVLKDKIAERPFFGHGFGATVTYESKDPRVVAQSGGIMTTYAFEWGWLEHWVKFGVFGIPVLVWVLCSLGRRFWRSSLPEWMRFSGVFSLLGLAVIHIFTPYLNHPLGMIPILGLEAFLVCAPKEASRGFSPS